MMALTSIPVGIPVGANPSSGNGRHLLPANYPILSLLDDVSTLDSIRLKQIHARMLRLGLFFQPYASSRLITACSLSPSPNLHYALQVFNQIPQPSLYMWNILIRSHVANSRPDLSLQLFSRLLTDSPHFPDNFTYPFAFKAAAELEMLREGSALHGQVVKGPFNSDVFILNSLVHFYATCGDVDLALRVFDFIPQRDVVSWNCMIAALARADRCDDALELFRMMQNGNISPDDITMVAVLSACGKKGDLELGRWLHSFIKRSGISECLILNNAILDMYTKCESSADARLLFDGMTEKDSISWTTMLFVYCKSRDFDAARHFFDTMPVRDIAAWNALISGYEQNGRPKDALAAFAELQNSSDAEPDQVTLVATLSACSQLCAIESGKWIHSFIEKRNLKLNHRLTASLIDMYSKCGDVENALQVFRTVKQGDVFVWSSMIAGLAMHGRGKEALEFFKQMQKANVKPNHVTFTNVLCACSHAGLVEVGRMYFTQMLTVYGIEPQPEHYGCMVDILGRAGRLQEAKELIEKMPTPPPPSIWGALLGACVVHRDINLGEIACRNILNLDPTHDGAYVLMSNLYAKAGKWEEVGRLRKVMKEERLKKETGRSSMEVKGVVHEFLVGDASHSFSGRIYEKLEEMTARLKAVGYAPNRTQVLQNVEDEATKDHALNLHSEKLAIAFGLFTIKPPVPIRINKNLRICEDCHSFAKLTSEVYEREILIRDRYRFHHFKEGSCSCGEFW